MKPVCAIYIAYGFLTDAKKLSEELVHMLWKAAPQLDVFTDYQDSEAMICSRNSVKSLMRVPGYAGCSSGSKYEPQDVVPQDYDQLQVIKMLLESKGLKCSEIQKCIYTYVE